MGDGEWAGGRGVKEGWWGSRGWGGGGGGGRGGGGAGALWHFHLELHIDICNTDLAMLSSVIFLMLNVDAICTVDYRPCVAHAAY